MNDANLHINLPVEQLSEVEQIKSKSDYLRGTIKESLEDNTTGSIHPDDTQLSKFHGIYQQFDRELEQERKNQKLEQLFSFMIRVRVPGGVSAPEQYLAMDRLSEKYANNTIKLTTRQAYQFHGVAKWDLKPTIQQINEALHDTIAACGDVNRNVMCSPNPYQSRVHQEVIEYAEKISAHLTPQTKAYYEIWLNKKLVIDVKHKVADNEPIYGRTYLPRKFKIALAVPPYNDTDIFTNDLGFIAISDNNGLLGFNVSAGGGMGSTLGDDKTYAKLGEIIGFVPKDKLIELTEEIVKVQRDFGNRKERKNARLKYTIDARGIEWLKNELKIRLGWELPKEHPYTFIQTGDKFGWHKGINGKWFYTVFIENGRIKDTDTFKLKTGLREIAKINKGDFRLTGNQNIIIGNIPEQDKLHIEELLKEYGIRENNRQSGLRLNSLACVALNTCSLAHAEAERYLPKLVDKIEYILDDFGLKDEPITIRMTGCPNGCARPHNAEIGLIGRAPGKYNLYLGAGFTGNRLNALYREMLSEEEILEVLKPILEDYARSRNENERFGDFIHRKAYLKNLNN